MALSEAAAEAETAIKTGQGVGHRPRAAARSLAAAACSARSAPRFPKTASGNGGGAPQRDPATRRGALARLKRLLETDDGEAADFIVDAQTALSPAC